MPSYVLKLSCQLDGISRAEIVGKPDLQIKLRCLNCRESREVEVDAEK